MKKLYKVTWKFEGDNGDTVNTFDKHTQALDLVSSIATCSFVEKIVFEIVYEEEVQNAT